MTLLPRWLHSIFGHYESYQAGKRFPTKFQGDFPMLEMHRGCKMLCIFRSEILSFSYNGQVRAISSTRLWCWRGLWIPIKGVPHLPLRFSLNNCLLIQGAFNQTFLSREKERKERGGKREGGEEEGGEGQRNGFS